MMKINLKKLASIGLVFCVIFSSMTFLPQSPVAAQDGKITPAGAKGKSAGGHASSAAIDGNPATYWQSPASGDIDDHGRYIEIDLGALYDLSEIKIFNRTGAYYHYQIYASPSGDEYSKIAYKSNSALATASGDTHNISGKPGAKGVSKVRVNVVYNSAGFETNLTEVELYGEKTGVIIPVAKGIQTDNFQGGKWELEYNAFALNKTYANQKTLSEMAGMVGRVIGERWKDSFRFEIGDFSLNNNDAYEISDGNTGVIIIKGNNGVALASGFNYYLKNFLNVNYNPMFGSNINMPDRIVPVGRKIIKETQYDYRYALNFCTYSYTMSFWGWAEYEAFLDWAAMNGLNLILDIVGQEEIIRRVFNRYGYTDEEIKDYITGPAYFAWYYMQNITGYGGPLPDNWFQQRVELGRKIHDRMQTYGITPVLQGFSGMVPTDFNTKNPGARLIAQGEWCGYTRPSMLQTYVDAGVRDYFSEMADAFYKAQQEVFGNITHYYAVDPFHEGGNTGNMNTGRVYGIVQQKMIDSDPDAIWVIQEWEGGLGEEKMNGLVNKNQALILDLYAEVSSYADRMENQKIPWIWNMLHNFGGRAGIDGVIETISKNIPDAYAKNNYMRGIGITPEGFGNSPIVYDLLFDMTWSNDPVNPYEYIENYARSRYGKLSDDIVAAWTVLLETAYAPKDFYRYGAPESVINCRPTENFTQVSCNGSSTLAYDVREFEEAVLYLINAYDSFKDSGAFNYDLADVVRQMLANSAKEYHKLMINAYREGNLELFNIISGNFLEIIELQDKILSCRPEFSLSNWIGDARSMLSDMDDWTKDLFEFNARCLVTTWGPQKSGVLTDYANRQWSGLTGTFYLERWKTFISNYRAALMTGESPKAMNHFLSEWEWVNKKSDEGFAMETDSHDIGELARQAYEKFSLKSADELAASFNENHTNHALNKPVSIIGGTGSETNLITDGDMNSFWLNGSPDYPVALKVDLKDNIYIEDLKIYFEKSGLRFQFEVSVTDENGQEISALDMRTNEDDLPALFKIPLNKTIRSITVNLTGRAPGGEFYEAWPALAEIMAIAKDRNPATSNENIAANKPTYCSSGYSSSNIDDGSLSSLWIAGSGDPPAHAGINLAKGYNVENAVLYFEASGRKFMFKVTVTDESGNKIVVLDKSVLSSEEEADGLKLFYDIPVNRIITDIRVDFIGKTGAPWPAIAELEVYKKSKSLIKNAEITSNIAGVDLNILKDADISSYIESNQSGDKVFDIDLGDYYDISTIEIVKSMNFPLLYKLEYLDPDSDEDAWNIILDKTGNINTSNRVLNILTAPVYARTIRLTVTNDELRLNYIDICSKNAGELLTSYIIKAQNRISSVPTGNYSGNAVQSAKDRLNNEIEKARIIVNQNSSSVIVTQQIEILKKELKAFNHSVIYINRNRLLAQLIYGNYIYEELLKKGNQSLSAELKAQIDNARTVYDTYKVTQEEIDSAASSLTQKIAEILPGNVNFDEKVDASDVVELRRLIKSGGATEAQKQAGDLNGDELLTDADATLLLEQLDIVLGDVDGSGNISALDVMVMRKLMLSGGITDAHLAAGDLDGSGELGALDIMKLRKIILEKS